MVDLGFDSDETSWSDASSVTDDTVIEQAEFTLDESGSVTQVVSRARLHTATDSQTGELTTPEGDDPKARVSYLANYYDPIGRQVATANYGAVSPSPSTGEGWGEGEVPERSDTILVTTYAFNDRGEPFSTIDPAGRETRQTFDDAGRLVSSIQNYVTGTANSGHPDQDVTVTYTYTADDKLSTLTAVNPTTGNQVTRYVYGTSLVTSSVARFDLLRAEIYPDSDDTASPRANGADGIYDRVEYTYNRTGQVVTKHDQNGTVHTYT